jgi:hypothetical protein
MRRISILLASAGALACSGGGGNNGGDGGTTQPPAAAPAISLSSAAANFSATAGAASPAAQTVTVTNSGTGTLSGLAVGTIAYAGGPTGGWLSASLTAATAPASMTLTPSTNGLLAGTYTATVPISSVASGVTNSPQSVSLTLTVGPGPPTHLVFAALPNPTAGGVMTPPVTVSIYDALGDLVTTATTSVTLAIGANGSGAVLSGTTTVAAVAGIATFSSLSVSKAGSGFTLVASAAGLTGATSAAFTVSSSSATSVTLAAAGQSTTFLSSPNFAAKLTLQPGSQYLVAVVNTDPSYTIQEGFSLTGSFGTSAAAQRLAGVPPLPPMRASVASQPSYAVTGTRPPSMASLGAAAQNHAGVLDDNRRIFASLGNPSARWARTRSQGGRAAQLSAAITQTIGAVQKVYVKHSLSGSCTAVDSIGARTVAVGQHIIVLADTNRTTWPQSLRPDTSFYQTFANEYDQVTYPHILANIGNPIAYDASLSNVGKITMTITPVLNNFAGGVGGGSIVAFVNGCDFYPYVASGGNADPSNQTEMFYSWIPNPTNGWTVPAWEAALRATAAHETKHIVSYTDRIINNSPVFEEIWLEEGLAQESAEIWERNFNQATWMGGATFLQTVACEIPLGANAPCDLANNKPYALLGSHLPFFFQYLQTESTSNGEGLGLDTPANYGAGWTIARWATDQYANGSEATFIKSLINDPQLSGLANLSAHTGQSVPLILVYWNLATAIFQTPSYIAADVRTTIPSFNFANIDSIGQTGLTCSNGVKCGLFGVNQSPSPTYPIQPIQVSATGTFTQTVNSVPGTSASYFLLSVPSAGVETLQLFTPSGAPLSSTSGFRVAILRVR